MRGHGVPIRLRVAKFGPLLWHRLPDFYDEQERAAPERDSSKRRAREIGPQRECAGRKLDALQGSNGVRPVVSLIVRRFAAPGGYAEAAAAASSSPAWCGLCAAITFSAISAGTKS